jgi:hypothetical protein
MERLGCSHFKVASAAVNETWSAMTRLVNVFVPFSWGLQSDMKTRRYFSWDQKRREKVKSWTIPSLLFRRREVVTVVFSTVGRFIWSCQLLWSHSLFPIRSSALFFFISNVQRRNTKRSKHRRYPLYSCFLFVRFLCHSEKVISFHTVKMAFLLDFSWTLPAFTFWNTMMSSWFSPFLCVVAAPFGNGETSKKNPQKSYNEPERLLCKKAFSPLGYFVLLARTQTQTWRNVWLLTWCATSNLFLLNSDPSTAQSTR